VKKNIWIALIAFITLSNVHAENNCSDTQLNIMDKLFYQGFSGGRMEVIDEVFHPEFELNHPLLPPGIAGVKTIVKMNNDAFDNWQFTIHDLICDGSKVVARYSATGIHINSFMGEKPTNKEVMLDGISIFVIKDKMIIKDWYMPDDLSFQKQLGLIPNFKH
jgi:predicted ester cyclase